MKLRCAVAALLLIAAPACFDFGSAPCEADGDCAANERCDLSRNRCQPRNAPTPDPTPTQTPDPPASETPTPSVDPTPTASPSPNATPTPVPAILTSDPERLEFGRVQVGSQHAVSLRLINAHPTRDIDVTRIAPTPDRDLPRCDDGVDGICLDAPTLPLLVPAADSAVLTLACRPSVDGQQISEVLTFFNDGDEAFTVVANCEGAESIGPRLTVCPPADSAPFEPDPNCAWAPEDQLRISYGGIAQGTTVVRQVLLRNTGDANLTVRSVVLQDDNGTEAFSLQTGIVDAPLAACARNDEGACEDNPSLTLRLAFQPDTLGDSTATLVITTTDVTMRVPVFGRGAAPPTARITGPGVAFTGNTVTLSGRQSSDPDGALPLSYDWRFRPEVGLPARSNAELVESRGGEEVSFVPDVAGEYAVALDVIDADGLRSEQSHWVAITVTMPERSLQVQLVWDHSQTDFDVHLKPAGVAWRSDDDCHFITCLGDGPGHNWCGGGPGTTDVGMDIDDSMGFGPENILYRNPCDGLYDVGARFSSEGGDRNPQTRATLRVWCDGNSVSEESRVLNMADELWHSVQVRWPGCEVTRVNTVNTIEEP